MNNSLKKRKKIEFEYRNLRNQVNPHFLFNSFSTLMALIDTDPNEATKYVEQLSDYFRHILEFRDTPLIKLSEELNLLQNYVELQKKNAMEADLTYILNFQKDWLKPSYHL